MLLSALCFLVGVVCIQQLAELPDVASISLAIAVVLVLWPVYQKYAANRYRELVRGAIIIIAGMLWASLRAQHYLDHRLPETLAGQDIYVSGTVEDIVVSVEGVQRFYFGVENIDAPGNEQSLPQKLRLSWYYADDLKAGERWRLLVRLKPPHGFLNPGGFDYEAWLYQQGVHATGYVRESESNQRLEAAGAFSVDAARQHLSETIQRVLAGRALAGLVSALAVGDRSAITQQQWQPLINTGTNHLMAISGLHIGLAAGFGFWLVRRLLPVQLMRRVAAQRVAVAGGLILACIYALLAGFSIPTQRALLMLVCFAGALLLKRNFRPLDALAAALLAILLWQPTAVLAAGFWFSFLAVAVIVYVFSGRMGGRRWWQQWGWMQFSIAFALFPLSLLLFQQTSLVSPLANFIMVPYVSFFVVPLVLGALLMLPLSAWLATQLLLAANGLLEFIWPVLSALSESHYACWTQTAGGAVSTGLAMLAVIVLLAPRGIPARWCGLVLLLPILSPSPDKLDQGAFSLDLLDVGQGLATVVRTAGHTLVFDTGARFSSRLDTGDAVVVPFLRQSSIDHIDRMVISHGDADHIGGADSILAVFPGTPLLGQDIEDVAAADKTACIDKTKWRWDGVDFEFLHPDGAPYAKRNNRSCVLKISGQGGGLLLTGDIEHSVEQRLLRTHAAELRSQVLVVPHHGSKSSSSRAFVDAVSADIVLFPAGYRNRYRLPHSKVVARYRQTGARLLSSGYSGAIRLLFEPGSGVSLGHEYRKTHASYWNHQPVPEWL